MEVQEGEIKDARAGQAGQPGLSFYQGAEEQTGKRQGVRLEAQLSSLYSFSHQIPFIPQLFLAFES